MDCPPIAKTLECRRQPSLLISAAPVMGPTCWPFAIGALLFPESGTDPLLQKLEASGRRSSGKQTCRMVALRHKRPVVSELVGKTRVSLAFKITVTWV
jgi:hypothetical protein